MSQHSKPIPNFTLEELVVEERAQQSQIKYWTTAELAEATGHPERTILRYLNNADKVLHTYKKQSTKLGTRAVLAYTIHGVETLQELIEALGLQPVTTQAKTIRQLAKALDTPVRTMRRYVKQALDQGAIEQAGVVPVESRLNDRTYRVAGYVSTNDESIQETMKTWTQE